MGSGPAGALVARHLAGPGRKAILVEAGPVARVRDFVPEAGVTMARYFFDGGMRVALGQPVLPTIQCRVLGGGSVFNSAICLPPAEFAMERWERDNGLEGFSGGALDEYVDRAWRFMGVRPTADDQVGPRDELFVRGARNMGWGVERIARNEDDCRGSGMCITGCPNGGKLSTDRRGVPEMLEAGGRVYTSLRVDRVLHRGGRAYGVQGWVVDPFTGKKLHRARITAKTVVLSAGAIGSPVILQRSGIRRKAIGANLGMHPGTMCVALFDHDVLPWGGASQGYHVLDFLEQGVKLETLWGSPELMAFRFPGLGHPLKDLVGDMRRSASWDAWVSGLDSRGRVRALPGGQLDLSFQVGEGDARRLSEAMAKLTEMAFAAGAVGAVGGVHGMPRVMTRPEQASLYRTSSLPATAFPVASNHVFGGSCMGADPELHATDGDGRVHGFDNLYVCDTGLFPDSPGVNPMFPAMVLAERMADHLVGRA